MDVLTEYNVWNREEKRAWGEGPWVYESDGRTWIYQGLTCRAMRSIDFGCWMGYVGVNLQHPYYGKHYNDVQMDVHGGLDYSAFRVDDGLWWFGFHCGHSLDLKPMDYNKHNVGGTVYRDMKYVIAEIERLADQLKEAA